MKIPGIRTTGISVHLLALALALFMTNALGAPAMGTGAFPKAQEIERQLVRGVSTKADVQKLLGIPSGSGEAILPGYGDKAATLEPYQIWYYEDIETGEMTSKDGVMNITLRNQILLVFFKEDKFHGFFWTSNQDAAEFR